ncbi:hypothetical protein MARCHEWKA_03360 [Brevundimonas phage vB_BpoS-Marchewka]|uniref:Uncharacterized protein n=1 Tax=Brevundimonas phage vB_BpoS-Marchewka TaxID=2948604 RepID=A0A9E7SQX7_9CAUD|nr:hypothetical protein MARCHEWKA_03360 [Brevundimonas phage vB_BpoS-Marchewka]
MSGEKSVAFIMTSMTDVLISSLVRQIDRLKAEHPNDPAAVVSGVENWAAAQIAQSDELWNRPVVGDFHRVIAPNGRVIRDWWPTPQPATLKAWLRRHAPDGSTVEHKKDIAREGDHQWFRGKSSGDAPDGE